MICKNIKEFLTKEQQNIPDIKYYFTLNDIKLFAKFQEYSNILMDLLVKVESLYSKQVTDGTDTFILLGLGADKDGYFYILLDNQDQIVYTPYNINLIKI